MASWQHQQEQQRQHLQHQHQRAQLQDSYAAQQDALLNALRQRDGVEAYLRAQAAAKPGGPQSPAAAHAITAAILQERLALFAVSRSHDLLWSLPAGCLTCVTFVYVRCEQHTAHYTSVVVSSVVLHPKRSHASVRLGASHPCVVNFIFPGISFRPIASGTDLS